MGGGLKLAREGVVEDIDPCVVYWCFFILNDWKALAVFAVPTAGQSHTYYRSAQRKGCWHTVPLWLSWPLAALSLLFQISV